MEIMLMNPFSVENLKMKQNLWGPSLKKVLFPTVMWTPQGQWLQAELCAECSWVDICSSTQLWWNEMPVCLLVVTTDVSEHSRTCAFPQRSLLFAGGGGKLNVRENKFVGDIQDLSWRLETTREISPWPCSCGASSKGKGGEFGQLGWHHFWPWLIQFPKHCPGTLDRVALACGHQAWLWLYLHLFPCLALAGSFLSGACCSFPLLRHGLSSLQFAFPGSL